MTGKRGKQRVVSAKRKSPVVHEESMESPVVVHAGSDITHDNVEPVEAHVDVDPAISSVHLEPTASRDDVEPAISRDEVDGMHVEEMPIEHTPIEDVDSAIDTTINLEPSTVPDDSDNIEAIVGQIVASACATVESEDAVVDPVDDAEPINKVITAVESARAVLDPVDDAEPTVIDKVIGGHGETVEDSLQSDEAVASILNGYEEAAVETDRGIGNSIAEDDTNDTVSAEPALAADVPSDDCRSSTATSQRSSHPHISALWDRLKDVYVTAKESATAHLSDATAKLSHATAKLSHAATKPASDELVSDFVASSSAEVIVETATDTGTETTAIESTHATTAHDNNQLEMEDNTAPSEEKPIIVAPGASANIRALAGKIKLPMMGPPGMPLPSRKSIHVAEDCTSKDLVGNDIQTTGSSQPADTLSSASSTSSPQRVPSPMRDFLKALRLPGFSKKSQQSSNVTTPIALSPVDVKPLARLTERRRPAGPANRRSRTAVPVAVVALPLSG